MTNSKTKSHNILIILCFMLSSFALQLTAQAIDNPLNDQYESGEAVPFSVIEVLDDSQEEEVSCDTHGVIFENWSVANGTEDAIGFVNFGVEDALQNACSEDNWKYSSSTLPDTFYVGFPIQLPSLGTLNHTGAAASSDFEAKTATPDTLADYTTDQVYRISKKNISNGFDIVMYADTDLANYWAEHSSSFLSFTNPSTMSVTLATVLKFEKVDTVDGSSVPTTDGDMDVVPQEN